MFFVVPSVSVLWECYIYDIYRLETFQELYIDIILYVEKMMMM